MSGEKSINVYSRKDFLKLGGLSLLLTYLSACGLIPKKKQIPVSFAGSNSKRGHLLRSGSFPEPSSNIQINTLIVGGGVAGLSAAWQFKQQSFSDWLLLELDDSVGGNSKSGKNAVCEYPYGAHYLPIPNENFSDLINFLKQNQIITGFDAKGLPIYNEYYLCAEPQERLFFKGIWHEGIPPKSGLTTLEQKELSQFLKTANQFKHEVGSDGKPAFALPLEWSSLDDKFLQLDKISMQAYLKQEGYKTEFLLWYINYCCKDDFGTDIKNLSAWAGLHYFASRNGKSANAESYEQLTWPEGNNFLVKCLSKDLKSQLKPKQLVYKIEPNGKYWKCYVLDFNTNQSACYNCENLILATPQFVNKRLLNFTNDLNFMEFEYYPWLVANVTINKALDLNGNSDLSWDNVIFGSKSLGYVNSCHQIHHQKQQKTVITYYYNFSEQSPKLERQSIYQKDENYWKQFIIKDLSQAHSNIEELVEEIEVYVYGHGMISPAVGFKTSETRQNLAKGLDNLYFINSDVSGISVFEQAFYNGITAAKKVLGVHGA